MTVRLEHGDMLAILPTLGQRFHAVVTDPPYHLASIVRRFSKSNPADVEKNATARKIAGQGTSPHGRAARGFMGKEWDGGDIAFRPETWAAVGAVMVPGAHLVAFAGTKGSHRMACAIEDAGFEIRDTLAWLYGSGFPKSHNMGKAMDKQRRRDFVAAALELGIPLPGRSVSDWTKEEHAPGDKWWQTFKASLPPETWGQIERHVIGRGKSGDSAWFAKGAHDITAPATDAAREWEGWGTALKPAYEPIVLARWPLGAKTVAGNIAEHRTGALHIDACRIGTADDIDSHGPRPDMRGDNYNRANGRLGEASADRRYTANRATNFAAKPGPRGGAASGRWPANVVHDGSEEVLAGFPDTGAGSDRPRNNGEFKSVAKGRDLPHVTQGHADAGGSAARFFYSSKADAADRLQSKHPTVKPVDLMRWLVRLVTPKGGLVLDPFAGSGTTGMACMAEGFDCTLIEREAEYAADIERRLAHVHGSDTPLFNAGADGSREAKAPLCGEPPNPTDPPP